MERADLSIIYMWSNRSRMFASLPFFKIMLRKPRSKLWELSFLSYQDATTHPSQSNSKGWAFRWVLTRTGQNHPKERCSKYICMASIFDVICMTHLSRSSLLQRQQDRLLQPTITIDQAMRIQLADPALVGSWIKQVRKGHPLIKLNMLLQTFFRLHDSIYSGLTAPLCQYTARLSVSIGEELTHCKEDQESFSKWERSS